MLKIFLKHKLLIMDCDITKILKCILSSPRVMLDKLLYQHLELLKIFKILSHISKTSAILK